jgi:alanine racemase
MILLDHLLQSTSGTLLHTGASRHFEGFSHDTRQLLPGELFVAVRGERGDGHDFLLDAVQRGASGLLVEGRAAQALPDTQREALERAGITTIVVEDTRLALQRYARFILRLWQPTVIAVGGSVGKTSTKEAIADVLSSAYATFRSWQNYNDLLGLPLSLGRLEERHEFAVLELGCDHPGEMQQICDIVGPTISVLTNASPTLLHYFGTLDRLVEEYGVLLASLPPDGAAFINGDDALLRAFIESKKARIQAPVTPFFPSSASNLQLSWDGIACNLRDAAIGERLRAPAAQPQQYATNLTEQAQSCHSERSEESVTRSAEILRFAQNDMLPRNDRLPQDDMLPAKHVTSHLLGAHHVATMLAAFAVGQHCRVPTGDSLYALSRVEPMPGRLRPLAGIRGARLLDDTHNAAPASMLAGLETLRDLPASRRIAVLGDMSRLGEIEEEAHRIAGQQAAQCADYLVVRGEYAPVVAEAARKAGLSQERVILTSTHEDAAQAVERLLAGEERTEKLATTVFIKGSEDARMERVTERLMAQPELSRERLVRQTPGWKQIVVSRPRRPTWVEIDLSAIAHNTRLIAEIVGLQVRILASLKADAYGHGAIKVAHTVLHNGAGMLGVATVSEATPLREAGIRAPILVFGYTPPWQMREAAYLDLTVTLYSIEAAQALSRAATALNKTVRVHVKVDTGMGRLGIRAEELDEIVRLVEHVRGLPGVELEGIFTHFATADSLDSAYARKQLARFQHVLHVLEQKHLRPPLIHAANSAALLVLPEAHFDMVRPGIALYGLDPSDEVRLPMGFRPALAFKTQVAQVKVVPAGEGISYGSTYVTERPTIVATLPVGYADGFRRGPANWGSVLIHEQQAPILGRVCMDQCMVDVSHIPQVRAGDEVVLIGRQGAASLTAEEVARRLGTIHYEVVSEILARVPRVD